MNGAFGNVFIQLVERGEIIDQPEASSLCGRNQVVIFNGEVSDRNCRKIQLERFPAGTVVKRNVHSGFGAGVKQTCTFRIDSHNTCEMRCVNSVSDFCPRFAVVFRFEKIWFEVAVLVTCSCDVSATFYKWIELDTIHHTELGHVRRCYPCPGVTAITCYAYDAVI